MRHPLFKAGIFTALIKNRDFRPLSLVLASMHSYRLVFVRFHLFFLCLINTVILATVPCSSIDAFLLVLQRKRMFSFCPFSFVFFCVSSINIVCYSVFAVCILETISVSILGTAGN